MSVVSFSGARRHLAQDATQPPLQIQAIVHTVARMSPSSSGSRLQVVATRPIRWPGDVHMVPRDVFLSAEEIKLSGRRLEKLGEGANGQEPPVSVVAVLVAVVCIALTPLWNWLFKKVRRPRPPPCQDGCGPQPVTALPDDKEMQALASRFIERRMGELSDKQVPIAPLATYSLP